MSASREQMSDWFEYIDRCLNEGKARRRRPAKLLKLMEKKGTAPLDEEREGCDTARDGAPSRKVSSS